MTRTAEDRPYHIFCLFCPFSQLGQVAEELHTVRSNVAQMIDRLAAEGLVERIFDPADRRKVLAQITEEGCRRSEADAQVRNQIKQDLLVHFSPEERDQLLPHVLPQNLRLH